MRNDSALFSTAIITEEKPTYPYRPNADRSFLAVKVDIVPTKVRPADHAAVTRRAAMHSRLYECEEVGVNLIRMRGRHTVRETRVGL
jgi:hypothetical protein